ncbi:MAG: hypothetical protein ACIAXF_11730 [Phycisphaerales bacterium JB063]
MNIKPAANNGRIIRGKTPFGDFAVDIHDDYDGPVYDADGREVGRVMLKKKDPAPLNLTTINAHTAICKQCPHAGAVTTTKRGRDVYTIRCKSKRCPSCAKVSLRHPGRCPEGKW